VAFALLAAGACSDQSGCNTQPLPGGSLPATQTIEGGAQIRVTNQGFAKLKALVPAAINSQLANGICVPEGTQYSVHYCYENQGQCSPGCKLDVGLNSTTFVATNNYTLTVHLNLSVNGTIPADAPAFSACHIFVTGNNIVGDADIEMRIDATTGELGVTLARIRNVDLSSASFSGDDTFCSGASSFADFLKDYFAQELVDYFTPRLDSLIQSYIPNPLGLEGLVDMGPLLESISPGTEGTVEARLVPGGFVKLDSTANGLSLGVITGINSDEDPNSRGPTDSSEPALCVPPMLPPDISASPYSLGTSSRGTFQIPLAPGFTTDVPGKDVSIGISHDTLNQIGHHIVTSGTMCLGIGTAAVPQLTVGTFGILVPSVAALASEDGKDPMLLVTRPQRAVTFTIGENTMTSPAITVHLKDVEIDAYAFLYERYVRAFTMSTTLDVGVNLDFDHPAGSPWRVVPTLVGLDASAVHVTVLNSDFIAEKPANLEAALPSVFNLLFTQLTIPPVALPTFAGFQISEPAVSHVTGGLDDFLAISANIDTAAPLIAPPPPPSAARVTSVVTPPPEVIRAGELPSVTVDVARHDAQGRELEWSWRLGKGLWRPFSSTSPLVIRDPAFAWQGEQTIGLVSRVKNMPATTTVEQTKSVVIDSVAPHVVTSKLAWDGDDYLVPAYDLVSEQRVEIAFGRPGDDEPATSWQTAGVARIDRTALTALLVDGELAVFLSDETGNRTIAYVAPFHGQAGASGCSCDTGSPAGGGLLLLAIAIVLRPRRRRRR
jgi:MYXO-CTERM domain-containing protein